mgnify:CR=1 FL=1
MLITWHISKLFLELKLPFYQSSNVSINEMSYKSFWEDLGFEFFKITYCKVRNVLWGTFKSTNGVISLYMHSLHWIILGISFSTTSTRRKNPFLRCPHQWRHLCSLQLFLVVHPLYHLDITLCSCQMITTLRCLKWVTIKRNAQE